MLTKKKILIAILLIVILLFVCFSVGQRVAYAKGFSQIKGQGATSIARWNFKVNGEETQMKSVSLSSTNKLTTLVDGKIAPGTKGFFEIIIDASEAETGLNYEIKFENETQKPTNLIFKCGETQSHSLKDLEDMLKGSINVDNNDKIKIYALEWEWKYETGNDPQSIRENDMIDTKDGKEISDYAFDITVTGTQITPE